MSSIEETTVLLKAWSAGDHEAGDDLYARIYEDLRRMARRRMAVERPDHTFNTTDLVHEAFLRLIDQRQADWQDRGQFFAISARVMRRILVDQARKNLAAKRGGEERPVRLEDLAILAAGEPGPEILAVDACLTEMAKRAPEGARLIDLRFFVGLSLEETAKLLGTSPATVSRRWRVAKGWLHRCLDRSGRQGSGST